MKVWKNVERPGYFGRRRDEKIENLNAKYGRGDWRLSWVINKDDREHACDFLSACVNFYQLSYLQYLQNKPAELAYICAFGEVIDNAPTNIGSGCDYSKQESWATHIQDIAIRNVLRILGLRFKGPAHHLLIIRSTDSNGFRFGPGNIPFYSPELIEKPSLKPGWANFNSVEDFWQSNKWIQVYS